jgi:uncharacterized protein YkwD
MKILNKIVLVIFLLILVFVIKNNYESIASKVTPFIKGEFANSLYKDKIGDTISKVLVDNNLKAETNTNTEAPGALIVPSAYLTYNLKSINLSNKNVIAITNEQRALNGNLPALIENSKLDFSAEKKLQDMFVKQYFEHNSPSGVGVGDLGNQVGYEYIIIGENLALGNFKDDKSLVDAWMASPGHRANILNNRYKEIGVAVGQGNYNGKSVWIAVQHFGLPKSVCPSIDEVLHGIISIDQKKAKDMEVVLASKRAKVDSGVISDGLTVNEQIDSYNTLVSDYNKLILNIKGKINTYNEEVKSFNSCIAGVQ